MHLSKSLLFSVIAATGSLLSVQSALATEVETFNVIGYPAANPQIQGDFTVYGSNGLVGPFGNGGLGAYGSPSTLTITSNGFLFDASSIEVGGFNSAIPAETETFIGDTYGGGTVTQSFQFPGNSQDFLTVNLVGFNALRDLRANVGFVTVQNLTYSVEPAPEPATFGLIGLCLTGAGVIYRKKRSGTPTK